MVDWCIGCLTEGDLAPSKWGFKMRNLEECGFWTSLRLRENFASFRVYRAHDTHVGSTWCLVGTFLLLLLCATPTLGFDWPDRAVCGVWVRYRSIFHPPPLRFPSCFDVHTERRSFVALNTKRRRIHHNESCRRSDVVPETSRDVPRVILMFLTHEHVAILFIYCVLSPD